MCIFAIFSFAHTAALLSLLSVSAAKRHWKAIDACLKVVRSSESSSHRDTNEKVQKQVFHFYHGTKIKGDDIDDDILHLISRLPFVATNNPRGNVHNVLRAVAALAGGFDLDRKGLGLVASVLGVPDREVVLLVTDIATGSWDSRDAFVEVFLDRPSSVTFTDLLDALAELTNPTAEDVDELQEMLWHRAKKEVVADEAREDAKPGVEEAKEKTTDEGCPYAKQRPRLTFVHRMNKLCATGVNEMHLENEDAGGFRPTMVRDVYRKYLELQPVAVSSSREVSTTSAWKGVRAKLSAACRFNRRKFEAKKETMRASRQGSTCQPEELGDQLWRQYQNDNERIKTRLISVCTTLQIALGSAAASEADDSQASPYHHVDERGIALNSLVWNARWWRRTASTPRASKLLSCSSLRILAYRFGQSLRV